MKAFLTGGMFWVNQYGDRLRPLASAASSHLIAAAVSRGFNLLGLNYLCNQLTPNTHPHTKHSCKISADVSVRK